MKTKLLRSLAAELEPRFFKVLGDPVRIELLKLLIVEGRRDVESLSELFPQDRSVISRHLAALASIGVLKAEKEGRHVFYSADADFFTAKLERILQLMREVRAECCPPATEPKASRQPPSGKTTSVR
jgi:DNA-binding transcriptional ArsR family regulator